MDVSKKLFIYTEENPKISKVIEIINVIDKNKNKIDSSELNNVVDLIKQKNNKKLCVLNKDSSKFPYTYSIEGLEDYLEIIIFSNGGRTTIDNFGFFEDKNFSDNLFIDLNIHTPLLIMEDTKTNSEESGNYIPQRLCKFINLFISIGKENYNKIPLKILYSSSDLKNKEGNPLSKKREFFSKIAFNLGILFEGPGFSEYEIAILKSLNAKSKLKQDVKMSLGEFLELYNIQEDNKSIIKSSYSNNDLYISISLSKNDSNKCDNDPNKGTLACMLYCLREIIQFKDNIKIHDHKVDPKIFINSLNKKSNKILEIINHCNVDIYNEEKKVYIKCREENNLNHYNIDVRPDTEKLVSIYSENLMIKDNFHVIFSNHAGAEKSNLSLKGRIIQIPKKNEYGQATKIPDIIFEKNDMVYIFEVKHQDFYKGLMDLELLKKESFFNSCFEKDKIRFCLSFFAEKGKIKFYEKELQNKNFSYIIFYKKNNDLYYKTNIF